MKLKFHSLRGLQCHHEQNKKTPIVIIIISVTSAIGPQV